MLTEDCERIINLGDDNWESPYLSEEDESIIPEEHREEERNKCNISEKAYSQVPSKQKYSYSNQSLHHTLNNEYWGVIKDKKTKRGA